VYDSGTWATPGGHLEHSERADHCSVREIAEEMGIRVDSSNFELWAIGAALPTITKADRSSLICPSLAQLLGFLNGSAWGGRRRLRAAVVWRW
jgi:8-oxo-dGTP pyrophosphatase MutT (NUDIX family)